MTPGGPYDTARPKERVLVSGVLLPTHSVEHAGPLTEVRGLVEAAGGEVVGRAVMQRRERPQSATLMGKGKVEEVHEEVQREKPDAVVVDNDLTPAQGRNLEKAWGVRVVDRSELILDIFARRARTHQARLQVELAQVEYMRPRLRRMWTHLERQAGGIGARGPGEKQLETDRRIMDKRVADLRAELAAIEARKRRQVRSRADEFTVGLVGYTNAGKSTLLNRLCDADVLSADMLFATLDTRTRKWEMSDGRVVLLSDTVGFLQRLPHHLVASFHATLEEALGVDLLLHVVDASHPDAVSQMRAVDEVLAELSPGLAAELLVFNKLDAVEDAIHLTLLREGRTEEFVHVSAATGEGIDRLEAAVAARLDRRSSTVAIELSCADGQAIAEVRALGLVEGEELVDDARLRLVVRLRNEVLGGLERDLRGRASIEVLVPAVERPSG